MIKFSGGEWFKISGRGNVYSCKVPEGGFSTAQVYEQTVEIDGKEYFVTGIETFAIFRKRTRDGWIYEKGESVGLLVRGEV